MTTATRLFPTAYTARAYLLHWLGERNTAEAMPERLEILRAYAWDNAYRLAVRFPDGRLTLYRVGPRGGVSVTASFTADEWSELCVQFG